MPASNQITVSQLDRVIGTPKHHDFSARAARLFALSVGLPRQFFKDSRQLDAGLQLNDALYRWARDGYEEGHDWPASRA